MPCYYNNMIQAYFGGSPPKKWHVDTYECGILLYDMLSYFDYNYSNQYTKEYERKIWKRKMYAIITGDIPIECIVDVDEYNYTQFWYQIQRQQIPDYWSTENSIINAFNETPVEIQQGYINFLKNNSEQLVSDQHPLSVVPERPLQVWVEEDGEDHYDSDAETVIVGEREQNDVPFPAVLTPIRQPVFCQ